MSPCCRHATVGRGTGFVGFLARGAGGLALFVSLLPLAPPAAAQDSRQALPPNVAIDFPNGQATFDEDGNYVIEGPVTLTWDAARFQADRITIREQRYFEATGNVLIVWQGNRIFGDRAFYDLETETGVFEDAMGHVEGDYLFWAKSAEKIGDKTVRIKSAIVTTCTQPTPYWSFRVSTAVITLDQYAKMWNIRVKASKVPFFYLPWLMWPVKADRALGLLFPEFQSTNTRGQAYSQELFIPLGRSADLTLLGRYYEKAGFGAGGEFRFMPNHRGAGSLSGFYIRDKVAEEQNNPDVPTNRYRATYLQNQQFLNGFRMIADLNFVSDFAYFSDFERDLDLVTSPTIQARLEFTRNDSHSSLNVRLRRREQLFSSGETLEQAALPFIEWRGPSQRLGRTPFYLTWRTSAAQIDQDGRQQGLEIDANYLRGDLEGTLSMALSKSAWFQATPSIRYRTTYWTQRQEIVGTGVDRERLIFDDGLVRGVGGAGFDFVGPRIVRIFNRHDKPGATKYKHLIEPRLVWFYQEEFDQSSEIIPYDEFDTVSAPGNNLNFTLTNRFFAKRPRARPEFDRPEDPVAIVGPANQSITSDISTTPRGADQMLPDVVIPEFDEAAPTETVEIGSIDLGTAYAFDNVLSRADFDGDGVFDETSHFSDVRLTGRYNPNPLLSLQLNSNYNVLHRDISSINVSGGLQHNFARLRFSVNHRNLLTPEGDSTTQGRVTAGLNFFGGKLRLDLDGSINFQAQEGQPTIPDRRIRVTWASQCCTILVETLDRQFGGSADRRDIYFRLELRGIGKIFDVSY